MRGVSDRYLRYAGGLMSPMQRCFSNLVCQPLVTCYVIDTYLFGHVAHLDPGVSAHDALRLMVDTYEGRKLIASWRRPPGRPRNIWLNKVQEDANALLLSMLWSWSGTTVHSEYATMTMMTMKDVRRVKNGGRVKLIFLWHLQAVWNRDC